jgi:hypothetical protein
LYYSTPYYDVLQNIKNKVYNEGDK